MAVPTSRQEFKAYCLRALGHPVIEINVDDDQVEDRIDEALKFYYDYNFDGIEKMYYKHQITAEDKVNQYIDLPENIIGAVNIFDVGSSINSGHMFNIQYQIALNDLYTLTAYSLVPFWMVRQHLSLIEEILVGKQPIRYNRHRNRLHIDMNWDRFNEGEYLIVEAYEVVDPETYTDVWGDRMLQNYAIALIKRQWGNHLKKYSGLVLAGGVQINGQQIYDEAKAEVKELEDEMVRSYSLPAFDMMG